MNDEVARGDELCERQHGAEVEPRARGGGQSQTGHFDEVPLDRNDAMADQTCGVRRAARWGDGDVKSVIPLERKRNRNAEDARGRRVAEDRSGRQTRGEQGRVLPEIRCAPGTTSAPHVLVEVSGPHARATQACTQSLADGERRVGQVVGEWRRFHPLMVANSVTLGVRHPQGGVVPTYAAQTRDRVAVSGKTRPYAVTPNSFCSR